MNKADILNAIISNYNAKEILDKRKKFGGKV